MAIVTKSVQRARKVSLRPTLAVDTLRATACTDVLAVTFSVTCSSTSVNGVATLSGFVIEDVRFAPVDPRITQYGTCTGHSLPVAQVRLAGYGTTVILDYLCGSSGSSGTGFALVKSVSSSDSGTFI